MDGVVSNISINFASVFLTTKKLGKVRSTSLNYKSGLLLENENLYYDYRGVFLALYDKIMQHKTRHCGQDSNLHIVSLRVFIGNAILLECKQII